MGWYMLLMVGLVALLFTARAAMTDFHFTSGASFSATDHLTCAGDNGNNILNMTRIARPSNPVPSGR